MNNELEQEMDKWEAEAKKLIKWVAVDANGAVWGFFAKPKRADRFWYNWIRQGFCVGKCVGKTRNKELRRNWDKSLRKIRYE